MSESDSVSFGQRVQQTVQTWVKKNPDVCKNLKTAGVVLAVASAFTCVAVIAVYFKGNELHQMLDAAGNALHQGWTTGTNALNKAWSALTKEQAYAIGAATLLVAATGTTVVVIKKGKKSNEKEGDTETGENPPVAKNSQTTVQVPAAPTRSETKTVTTPTTPPTSQTTVQAAVVEKKENSDTESRRTATNSPPSPTTQDSTLANAPSNIASEKENKAVSFDSRDLWYC